MAWIQVKPTNSGGGRRPAAPTAKLYESGQLTLSSATSALLGFPPKVLVQVEPDQRRIRLQPTTPENQGGFALSGGGNSPHRIGFKAAATKYPRLVGDYSAVKIAGGIELRKAREE